LEISKRQRYDWRSQADLPINDPQVRRAVKDLSEKIDKALQRAQTIPPHEQTARRQHAQSEVETASKRLVDQIDLAKKKVGLRRILWVDDRPDNNIFERRAMEAYSIQFVLALSTAEALEKIAEHQFDVIISDMGALQTLVPDILCSKRCELEALRHLTSSTLDLAHRSMSPRQCVAALKGRRTCRMN
jgi:CheY-like chemotaxis protein